MKNKIVLGCFIAASMLAMPSCSDFLTENPKGKLTPENFFFQSKRTGYECLCPICQSTGIPM